ncbi:hypothetical protein BDQ17DRAFT_1366423 [Cyathus striatus]|nr:hypothetical protein BDQ17DRAFT_1366423 [Cyathus striatus]
MGCTEGSGATSTMTISAKSSTPPNCPGTSGVASRGDGSSKIGISVGLSESISFLMVGLCIRFVDATFLSTELEDVLTVNKNASTISVSTSFLMIGLVTPSKAPTFSFTLGYISSGRVFIGTLASESISILVKPGFLFFKELGFILTVDRNASTISVSTSFLTVGILSSNEAPTISFALGYISSGRGLIGTLASESVLILVKPGFLSFKELGFTLTVDRNALTISVSTSLLTVGL